MIVIGFVVIAVNHSVTEFMKVIVLDDTWWADPRLGDLSEPLPPPLVEVVPSPYCQYSHQCCLSNWSFQRREARDKGTEMLLITSSCSRSCSSPSPSLSQGESEETAMLLYTSGATSGSPRGVTLSHSILGKQVHIVQSWLTSVIFSVPWSSPAKPPTCRSSGLSTPGTGLRRTVCFTALASGRPTDSSTHCRWFSPDFLLFFGDGFDFFYFASQLYFILFSGSSLNGCKNNPHAPVRPTQGECLLIFFSMTMMVKIGKCLTDSRWTPFTCTLLSLK